MIVHNLLLIQLTLLQLSLLHLTIQANVVDVNKQGMQANKRPQQKLPNEPILFKFEISDAVEPSDEVKALLQQQRQKITPKLTTTTTTTTTTRAPAVKRSRNGSGRKSKRNKRATSAAQAFDHKSIKFIPFVVSEAREPDEITKAIIKRMRQLELKQHNVAKSASEKKRNQRQIKRIRRAATLTKPEMISFELADAKLALRETRHLKQNASSEDQSTQEAKRYYVYKEAPIKLRKSTHVVPTEVQEVLDLLSNYKTPKPYVKYVFMQQLELSAMKNAFYYNKFGSTTKLQPVAYIKSVRPYVKKPTALSLKGYITESPAVLDNPIVVSPASENVETSQKNNYEFRPSKPDTYLTEQKQHNEIYDYGKYYKTYTSQPKQQVAQEQVYKVATSTETPLIKIEYHVPANVLKGDYKDFDDFKQLSTLIGKSPQDQMHGLTYLLAKEMQHKLHSQRQPTKLENVFALRPQDSTAPVLFEPEEKPAEDDMDNSDIQADVTEKIMGMAKTKTYVPIVENVDSVKSEKPMPTSTSFIHYDLYSNKFKYNTDNSQNQLVVQHPAVSSDTVITPAKPHMKSETSEYNINHDKLQYASKYTFGYRIRDFYTGNDFGHKQNRDLHGVTRGQYHILLPDGRIQNVIYHADDSGFHADVSFEGGTK